LLKACLELKKLLSRQARKPCLVDSKHRKWFHLGEIAVITTGKLALLTESTLIYVPGALLSTTIEREKC
jgi:hypothetical protein